MNEFAKLVKPGGEVKIMVYALASYKLFWVQRATKQFDMAQARERVRAAAAAQQERIDGERRRRQELLLHRREQRSQGSSTRGVRPDTEHPFPLSTGNFVPTTPLPTPPVLPPIDFGGNGDDEDDDGNDDSYEASDEDDHEDSDHDNHHGDHDDEEDDEDYEDEEEDD
jgi:hypothetical protein